MRLAWRELVVRRGRTLGLAVAIFVAATGFTVLTATSSASRLETVGVVQANARTTYDILVRPAEARTPVERSQRLVQPGFLGGTLGGITERQWHEIKSLRNVEVAAPIAVIGVVTPVAFVYVDTTGFASRRHATTWRIGRTWHLADGADLPAKPDYVMSTPAALGVGPQPLGYKYDCSEEDSHHFYVPQGRSVSTVPTFKYCYFQKTPAIRDPVYFSLPMVIVAVDPEQEQELVGPEDADDDWLAPLTEHSSTPGHVPVLISDNTPVTASLDVTVEQLPTRAHRVMTRGRQLKALAEFHGPVVARRTIDADRAYEMLQRQLGSEGGYGGRAEIYTTVGQPQFTVESNGELRAVPMAPPNLRKLYRFASGLSVAPLGTGRTPFRTIDTHEFHGEFNEVGGEILQPVGQFDATALSALNDVTAQILAGYATAPTSAADDASRAIIGDGPVDGSTDLGALVQAPPSVITDIANSRKLTGSNYGSPTDDRPISAIRVRVRGVTGVDPLSRERVRVAAQQIKERTGLDVDITVGASYVEQTLVQPATPDRPQELRLRQAWVKLGVATAILQALDKKSLVLFVLVLLVSALSVTNSAIASVRGRRTHLGTLTCLGWSQRDLFQLVLMELGIIGTLSGLAAALTSVGLGQLSGTHVSWTRAGLALPVAIAVTLIAGLGPAALAARARPLDALQPAVTPDRRIRKVTGLTAYAITNLARVRSRTLLAVAGLAVATCVFTVLLAVAVGFQGAVVGTALGNTVAVQVRRADEAAAAATLLLAGLGVANLMYLNIRDRGAEIATLRALGWTEGQLRRLLLFEGLGLGLAGGVLGAVVGYLAAYLLIGSLPGSVLAGAVAAAAGAVAVACAATLLATRLLQRVPTLELLSE